MELLPIVITSSLTTICILCLIAIYFLTRMAKLHERACRKLVEDLQTAHNANAVTIENLINKVNDVETKLRLVRR